MHSSSHRSERSFLWQHLLRQLCVLVALVSCTASAFAVRTLVDETGRQLRLPDRVQRVVCLTPSVADSLYNMGAADLVVGVTDYTFYPPEAARKPHVGDILRPSLERIAVLHPDVVIAVAELNSAETIRGLERMGVPVFLLDGSGIEGLYHSIASIGRVVGRDNDAAALISRLRTREQRVRQQAASSPRLPVFLAISLDPCITAGSRAFITELMEAAGAHSVTSDLPQEWVDINIEAILPRKPQFVLVLSNAPFGQKEMLMHAGWKSLEAVRSGRVLRIDDRLQYPSPVALDALESFARQLHTGR